MAKKGLDYFSVDVTFDTSLEVVVSKLGDKSLAIIIRIWQHIYKHNGYYMDYNEDELYMIKKMLNDSSIKEIEEVIKVMVSKNLFDTEMFENKQILTSKRLQDNYKEATKRRINADKPLTYCLQEVNIFKQSKVKESKEDKSKEKKDKKEPYFSNPILNNLFEDFLKQRKKLKAINSDRAITTILNKLNKFSDDIKIQMINNALVGSWKTVYEIKGNGFKKELPKDIESDWLDEYIKKVESGESENKLPKYE